MIAGVEMVGGKWTYFRDGGEGKEGIGGEDQQLGASVGLWISRRRGRCQCICVCGCVTLRGAGFDPLDESRLCLVMK